MDWKYRNLNEVLDQFLMEEVSIIDVTPVNATEHSLFCVRDTSSIAFTRKLEWFKERYEEGLKIKIVKGLDNRLITFIEYIPAEYAWRPLDAPGYMFIHCMYVHSKKDKGKGYASMMLDICREDARNAKMHGMAVMTSKGSWMPDKRLYEKYGFHEADRRERFELMVLKETPDRPNPVLIDWTIKQNEYRGWHLLYSDQCPWHEKSAGDLKKTADEFGINLKITKINNAREARFGPSGFGVFSLLHNGKLLEDHYISSGRFKNILKKELQL